MKKRQRSDETGCLVVVDRRNDARHGCALPAAGSGPGPGALLLEDSVGCECGAAHRRVDERQHEPVRSCPYRDAGSELRRYIGPGGLCAHLFSASIARPWLRSFCPWGESRAMSQWPAGRSTNRPMGSATRCSSSTSMSSARRRRKTSPTSCAMSRDFLSICSPTWRCRSASTTAASP